MREKILGTNNNQTDIHCSVMRQITIARRLDSRTLNYRKAALAAQSGNQVCDGKPLLAHLAEQAFRRDHGLYRKVAKKYWPRFDALYDRVVQAGIKPPVYIDKLSMECSSWIGRKGWSAFVNLILKPESIELCANTNTMILTAVPQSPTQIEIDRAHALEIYREGEQARLYIESDGECSFTVNEELESEVAELIDRAYYVTGERTYDGILAALRIKREKQKIWDIKGGLRCPGK